MIDQFFSVSPLVPELWVRRYSVTSWGVYIHRKSAIRERSAAENYSDAGAKLTTAILRSG